jgi:hypothetical protein
MHDVVSDILANPSVPRGRKGAEIARAGRRFRDDTTLVMASEDAWRTMSREMGVENMGGPAIGFQAALPTPTVTYGAVMHHDDATGRMVSVKDGAMTGAHGMGDMPGMTHTPPADTARRTAETHAGHEGMAGASNATTGTDPSRSSADLQALHAGMMADPVIHARVMADPELHGLVERALGEMPAGHHASKPAAKPARKPIRKPATTRAAKPAARPAAKPADPHAGHHTPTSKP